MAAKTAAKIQTLVKNLKFNRDTEVKSKDLTDLFAGTGLDVKASTPLDEFLSDMLWEKLTRANQIVNIDDYIDGITYIAPLVVKPVALPPEPEKVTEAKPADAGNGSGAADKSAEKKTGSGKDQAEGKAGTKTPGQEKKKTDGAKEGQASGQREKQSSARSATERFEQRTSAASAMAAGERRNDKEKKDKNKQNRHGIEIRERTGSVGDDIKIVTPGTQTRVVDTRGTSNVDLSKYDEKLDSFVSDNGKLDTREIPQKNKVKKTQADQSESGSSEKQGRGKGSSQSQKVQVQTGKGQQPGRQSGKPAKQTGGKDQAQGGKNQSHGGKNQTQGGKPQQNGGKGQGRTDQKGKSGRGKTQVAPPPAPVKKQPVKAVIPDEITVGDFAQRIKVTAGEVVKRLMLMGMMVTVNQTIDYDTAALIAEELGAEVSREVVVSIEEKLFEADADTEDQLKPRAPVVCVMGHVDHGKTSLLDAIRNTRVTAGEAGGITQHIGAYRVKINGREITFLDTPGHEAFTAMRARGAMATDIAILVVAADDGIMPQTVEAINHAKAAGVEIIVAINKMDKPGANPDAIKQELTKYELVPEEWGGDVMCVPVSALKKTGIDELLESILLIADVKEYKANPDRRAKGVVIESRLDKGRGPVATVLIQNGTLHSGDIVIAGTCVGRVRAMSDHTGRTVKSAAPSMPVEITGLDDVPSAGDEFNAVEDERMARELADQRRAKAKEETFKANSRASLGDLFAQIKEGVKDFNIIVKADVVGSAEAVKQSLEKLSNDEVRVHVIHAAAGGITEGDVMFAQASSAIIIGFNVRPDRSAVDSAERQGVEIRTYRVIYECLEEVEAAMKGMLAPKFRETVLGHAEVRQVIHVPNVGFIAGSYVLDGKITRSSKVRILRDSVVIYEDKISSLRRFKDDVREVAQGFECGIGFEKFNDLKNGDVVEAFVMEEIEAE